MMQRILVATDFSTRSDRAVQRASLLAREFGAEMVLVTVVDDDQPRRLRELEQREADALLRSLARTVHESASVSCDARVELGEPFRRVIGVADEINADLVVIGPHRRQALRDIFVGTTAERTIRHSRRPVLMANAVPARGYGRIIVATDYSQGSARAIGAVRALGFVDTANIVVAHVFDPLFEHGIARSTMTMREHQDYVDREQKAAQHAMIAFLDQLDFSPSKRVVELIDHSVAMTIQKIARREQANLVVVGTHGRSGAERFLLGSVAEDMFRQEAVDVIAVPAI